MQYRSVFVQAKFGEIPRERRISPKKFCKDQRDIQRNSKSSQLLEVCDIFLFFSNDAHSSESSNVVLSDVFCPITVQ